MRDLILLLDSTQGIREVLKPFMKYDAERNIGIYKFFCEKIEQGLKRNASYRLAADKFCISYERVKSIIIEIERCMN